MALRIFETDPGALKTPTSAYDVVGRFRSGMQENGVPTTLENWRVTVSDPEVGHAIASMYGGTPREWETTKEDALEVLTNTDNVGIIVDGPDAISAKMVLWANGIKFHECDGVSFLNEDQRGQPCGCPTTLQERKELARSGRGPKPEVSVKFRLADDPELGYFRMQTGSWDLVKTLHIIEGKLANIGGPALAKMYLNHVEYTTKKGREVSYRHAMVDVVGPAE